MQPQFNLLQKTIVMAEGVARQLNPAADMWELSKPLAANWVATQTNPERLLAEARTHMIRFANLIPVILDKLEKEQKPQQEMPATRKSPLNSAVFGALCVTILWIMSHYFSQ